MTGSLPLPAGGGLLPEELASSPAALRNYVSNTLREMLDEPSFLNHLAGQLPSDAVSLTVAYRFYGSA